MVKNRKTPYYLIHKKQFDKNCRDLEMNFYREWGPNVRYGYSVKTNNCSEMLMLAKHRGWLAEVVSQEEYGLAEKSGYQDSEIICNGPVKGNMIGRAIKQRQIVNIDNLCEIDQLLETVSSLKMDPSQITIGLRVNTDLGRIFPEEAVNVDGISRFGISVENHDLASAVEILKKRGIAVRGLHLHSSSKTRSVKIFRYLAAVACEIDEIYDLDLSYVDIGGGFWGGQVIDGKPLMCEYAAAICNELKRRFSPSKVTLLLEPGASVAATAVDYVTTVENIRDVHGKRVVTLDGTLLHINPFMLNRDVPYDIDLTGDKMIPEQYLCGCTCMERDCFNTLHHEGELLPGMKIIFHNVGAYTCSFNSRFIVPPPDIYVD